MIRTASLYKVGLSLHNLLPREEKSVARRTSGNAFPRQGLFARNAEDIFDAFFFQAIDEQVGCFFHVSVAPFRPSIGRCGPKPRAGDLGTYVDAVALVVRPRVPAAPGSGCNRGISACHASARAAAVRKPSLARCKNFFADSRGSGVDAGKFNLLS